LRTNVRLSSVVRRAGHNEAVLSTSSSVAVLKEKAQTLSLDVHFTRSADGSSLPGLPVKAVESDDEQVLYSTRDCLFLYAVQVTLVGIVSAGD
jgi:hypothetical protein